ncbi:MAG: arylsulfatase [Acidobacteria bacterium]|nr:arylsulfatase [Acidobacteriota bacterium]
MTRRQFLASTAASVPALGASAKPNIVIIMADDMGFSDLGCYGSELETPNLDKLAAGGLRFTQFYNTARCCPTRASLLTGLYPHQAGMGHMVNDRGLPSYQGYLNKRCVTIAEALKPAGYTTLMVGKWHVGENRPHWPCDRGFDRYFGLISGASNYWKLDAGRKMAYGNDPYTPPSDGKFYMTDAFTEHAVKFVDEAAGKADPFLLYLAYTSPHWPLHAWPADIARFRGKFKQGWDRMRASRHKREVELGLVDKKWPLTPRDAKVPEWDSLPDKEKDEWDLRMAVYAAQIYRMDQGIGRLVKKLEERGALNNTLILFLCDNGGCAEENIGGEQPGAPGPVESFTSYRTPWANASNTPFRLYKHWVHEGGIASPLIAHWPARIKAPGKLSHEPSHLVDLMATAVDAGGATYPKERNGAAIQPMEGRSLVPVFEKGRRAPHPALYWEHEGNRAVREGKWKLVSRHPGGWELYDLESDRTEMNNLAARDRKRVERMTAMYQSWADRVGAVPWDSLRPAGKKK